ncbi:helix-turn-helix protein [Haloactinospora alba]|uniref:Helix-turn-helix protein n=1 Tax=Haloactinospora alba TaxID=405555 RepID=A0A543NNV5_9ACTN|nr:helix-turn-helix transcriptional regulator [Haloactinospora alba]TQN33505.1 helix-turn-helix protein [Haloactinospora alba]
MRLATLRRWRGMTQAQLAGLSGVTTSYISMLENGRRLLDRRSHISSLAAALEVSETDLVGGPHLTPDAEQARPHTVIPPLETALTTNRLHDAVVVEARPLGELARLVRETTTLQRQANYIALVDSLPNLLDELHFHVSHGREHEQRQALDLLIETCSTATMTAKHLGYPQLAHIAATRAVEAAHVLDTPVYRARADYLRIQTLTHGRHGWERNLHVASQTADRLQELRRGDAMSLCPLGMVTLTAGLAAASALREQEAYNWLEEAEALARHVPNSPKSNWGSFSMENVRIWRVAIQVELQTPPKQVRSSAYEVDIDRFWNSRIAALHADVGRALARDPSTGDDAVPWLSQAERYAPQAIRNNARVHEAVSVLTERARRNASGRALRGMAARMGVPH